MSNKKSVQSTMIEPQVALDSEVKSSISNMVTTDKVQTITASKKISVGGTTAYARSFEILMPTSTESNPTENKAREIAFISSEGAGNNYEGSLTHQRFPNGSSYTGLRVGCYVNGEYKGTALGVEMNKDGVSYGLAPSTPNNAVGNIIVTTDYLKNNFVDKTTTQTISGSKIYLSEIQKKSTKIDITSKATSGTFNTAVRFFDKNGKDIGALNNAQINGGLIRTSCEARNKDGYVPSIGVQAPYEGSTGGFGYAPNTPANAIATIDYVKNYVDKTSTQTISGSKHFTQPSVGMSIDLVADTNQQMVPATAAVRQLGLYRNSTYTKGDGYTCWLQGYRGSDGHTGGALYTRRFLESDSQEIINYLQATVTSDGTPISYTKTPPAFCLSEEIVTAGWFRLPACVVRTVIDTYVNGTSWYRIWSDGWKEQGGRVNVGTDSAVTVTFLKPFSNANYYANWISCNGGDITSRGSRCADTLTTTTMRLFNGQDSVMTANWYACGF